MRPRKNYFLFGTHVGIQQECTHTCARAHKYDNVIFCHQGHHHLHICEGKKSSNNTLDSNNMEIRTICWNRPCVSFNIKITLLLKCICAMKCFYASEQLRAGKNMKDIKAISWGKKRVLRNDTRQGFLLGVIKLELDKVIWIFTNQ